MQTKSIYLNTDLVIILEEDPSLLAKFLEEKSILMYAEKGDDNLWYLSAESEGSGECQDGIQVQRDLEDLLNVIDSMEDNLKAMLIKAKQFIFNIGWEASMHRPEGVFHVTNELLRRIAGYGAKLTVTIYPPETTTYCSDDRN